MGNKTNQILRQIELLDKAQLIELRDSIKKLMEEPPTESALVLARPKPKSLSGAEEVEIDLY